jgi:7-cyano-7-deazaguanine synthase
MTRDASAEHTGILLSGGMDSIALAYWQRSKTAFTVDYGQRSAEGEIRAAAQVSSVLGMNHVILRTDCRSLGSGDLAGVVANPLAPVPEWWPFRNQLLVTLAGMSAVSLGVKCILVGSVSSDGLHADGRAEFFEHLDVLMQSQEGEIHVRAPAIGLRSVELIKSSRVPRNLLSWAHSCHRAQFACGLCRGCNKHREVTTELWGEDNAF